MVYLSTRERGLAAQNGNRALVQSRLADCRKAVWAVWWIKAISTFYSISSNPFYFWNVKLDNAPQSYKLSSFTEERYCKAYSCFRWSTEMQASWSVTEIQAFHIPFWRSGSEGTHCFPTVRVRSGFPLWPRYFVLFSKNLYSAWS